MKTSVIAIIPARYASSRFPAKMLAPILEKSLLQRTYERVKACSNISDVIIATDDIRIQDHAKTFGATCVMTSIDHQTGSDRLIEVLQTYPELTKSDIILNVQGDEPCINPKTLDTVCQALISNPAEVMATVAVKITDTAEIQSPSVVKCVMDTNNHALYFSRSPIPGIKPLGKYVPTYHKHLGIYAFRRNFLVEYGKLPQTPLQLVEDLEQLKVLEAGFKIKVVYTDVCSPAVDIPEDIQKVTEWLCNSQNTYS
ncbi:MAG: 3-deoxy-manno-octulosonate cytidylyltransferase [Chlamydiales bacterium]|nr:3-deoxy-manno-octulosonate cytidylyltransferase [Chlamydiales bacterium]